MRVATQRRMTRFQRGGSVPGHARAQNKNEADRSRATKTGQIDELLPLIEEFAAMLAELPLFADTFGAV